MFEQTYIIDVTIAEWKVTEWRIVKIPWFAKFRKHKIKAAPVSKFVKKDFRIMLSLNQNQVSFIQRNPELIKQFLQINGTVVKMIFHKTNET